MENKSKNLIPLSIFALFFVFAHSAFAYVPGVFGPERTSINQAPAFTEIPTVYNNGYYDSVTASRYADNNNYNNAVNAQKNASASNNYSSTTYTTNKVKSDTNNSYPSTVYPYQNTNSYSSNSGIPVDNSQISGNNLAALSLNGSGGFMPSSVWQWIITVFLILVIVIIARIMAKKPANREIRTAPTH